MSPQDPRRHVFRYDQHMPETDDLSLIVLKGHLLVEEMLLELANLAMNDPQHMRKARLSFHQLACIVRAIVPSRSDDDCWTLIAKLNALRNQLAHKLEPPDLQRHIAETLSIDRRVQPFSDIMLDKAGEDLDAAEVLRQAVVGCMQFLRCLILECEERQQ